MERAPNACGLLGCRSVMSSRGTLVAQSIGVSSVPHSTKPPATFFFIPKTIKISIGSRTISVCCFSLCNYTPGIRHAHANIGLPSRNRPSECKCALLGPLTTHELGGSFGPIQNVRVSKNGPSHSGKPAQSIMRRRLHGRRESRRQVAVRQLSSQRAMYPRPCMYVYTCMGIHTYIQADMAGPWRMRTMSVNEGHGGASVPVCQIHASKLKIPRMYLFLL